MENNRKCSIRAILFTYPVEDYDLKTDLSSLNFFFVKCPIFELVVLETTITQYYKQIVNVTIILA